MSDKEILKECEKIIAYYSVDAKTANDNFYLDYLAKCYPWESAEEIKERYEAAKLRKKYFGGSI